jgi:hypothetical protein
MYPNRRGVNVMKRAAAVLGFAVACLGFRAGADDQGAAPAGTHDSEPGGAQRTASKERPATPATSGDGATQARSSAAGKSAAAPTPKKDQKKDQQSAGASAAALPSAALAPRLTDPWSDLGTARARSRSADLLRAQPRDQELRPAALGQDPGRSPGGLAPARDPARTRSTAELVEASVRESAADAGRSGSTGGTTGAEQRRNAVPEPSAGDRTGSGAPDPASGRGSSAPTSPAGSRW